MGVRLMQRADSLTAVPPTQTVGNLTAVLPIPAAGSLTDALLTQRADNPMAVPPCADNVRTQAELL